MGSVMPAGGGQGARERACRRETPRGRAEGAHLRWQLVAGEAGGLQPCDPSGTRLLNHDAEVTSGPPSGSLTGFNNQFETQSRRKERSAPVVRV